MATPPSTSKQFSPLSLLTPLLSLLLISGLLLWQRYSQHLNELPSEIIVAQNALKRNDADSETAARRQFDKLLTQSPQNAPLFRTIMSVCTLEKRYALSLDYGERALQSCKYESNTNRAYLLMTMAETFTQANEAPPQPHALAFARRAMELDPYDPEVLGGYGYILADNARTLQEVNQSVGYITKALQIYRARNGEPASQLAAAEDSYGWALYKRGKYNAGDYARAVDTLTQAVDDCPEELPGDVRKVLYFHLGSACQAAGRIEAARHALQVSLFYDSKYEAAQTALRALPPTVVTNPDGY